MLRIPGKPGTESYIGLIPIEQKWSTCSVILKPARHENTLLCFCLRAKINLTLNLFPFLVKVVSIRRIVSKIFKFYTKITGFLFRIHVVSMLRFIHKFQLNYR